MTTQKFNPIIEVADDGMECAEVGRWAQEKYNLVGAYANIFTKSMRSLWNNLVYIDLYAGSGYSKIADTNKIIKSSPLIALSLPVPFDKYIFCEKKDASFKALKARVEKESKDIVLVQGDCNEKINEIKGHIPKYSRGNTVLTFCFVDPFSLNLQFTTIKKLSHNIAIDFLILLALGMDANRNLKIYLNKNNNRINSFLDNKDWRKDYSPPQDFVKFLSGYFSKNMHSLGYIIEPNSMHQIRSDDKNLPLYHLAFFSKNRLGNKFWREVKKYSNPQQSLFKNFI